MMPSPPAALDPFALALGGGEATWILYYVLVCLVVAFVTTAMRLRQPRRILLETSRAFVTIVVGILIFSAIVFVLEWIFVRPLVG